MLQFIKNLFKKESKSKKKTRKARKKRLISTKNKAKKKPQKSRKKGLKKLSEKIRSFFFKKSPPKELKKLRPFHDEKVHSKKAHLLERNPVQESKLLEDKSSQKAPSSVVEYTEAVTTQETPPHAIKAMEDFSYVQLSKHTQRAYKNDLKDFFSFLKVNGKLDSWNNLESRDIAEFRSFLYENKKLAKTTVTRKLAVLKSFFKWSHAQKWVDRNPAELVRGFPQRQESNTGFLDDDEVDKLLNYYGYPLEIKLSDALSKVVVETLLMLGLRRGEAVQMCLGDLIFQDKKWLIKIKGKGDRERLLPIPNRLAHTWSEWLQRIIPDESPLSLSMLEDTPSWQIFFKQYSTQPIFISTRFKSFDRSLSTSEVGRIVRKSAFRAGIVNRVSPHMLRSTAITHALDSGASHRGVQQMAGWTTPLMITRYDKRKNDPKFSAIHNLKYAQDKDEGEAETANELNDNKS